MGHRWVLISHMGCEHVYCRGISLFFRLHVLFHEAAVGGHARRCWRRGRIGPGLWLRAGSAMLAWMGPAAVEEDSDEKEEAI